MSEVIENLPVKLFFILEDGTEKELNCSVKKFYGDRFSIDFPKETLDYANFLQEGDEVLTKIFTPSGVKIFNAIILDSPLEKDFIIEYVEDSKQIQRRNFIRETYNTKIIIQKKDKNIVTHTLDIGGGGIRFFAEENFEEDEELNIMLYLPIQLNSIKAEAKILRKDHLPDSEHVLIYNKITEFERSKIIKFCYDVQMKRLEV